MERDRPSLWPRSGRTAHRGVTRRGAPVGASQAGGRKLRLARPIPEGVGVLSRDMDTQTLLKELAPTVGYAALPESLESLQRRFELPVAKRGRLLLIEDAWSGAIRHAVTKSGAAMD